MDINQLIAIIKNKLLNEIEIDNILIEDKSFLHKNHPGNQQNKLSLSCLPCSSCFPCLVLLHHPCHPCHACPHPCGAR